MKNHLEVTMKKTIPIILITSFSCSLAGCSTRRQVSQEVTSSNEVTQVEVQSGYAYKLSDLHEINQNDLVSSDTSQFYDMECNPINPSELPLKRYENYLIDDQQISLSEVILSPVPITAYFRVKTGEIITIYGTDVITNLENDNIQMQSLLQKIIGFNTKLQISLDLERIQYVPESDRIITYYFYPICYKVETFDNKFKNPSDTFYTLKGGHQANGLFCDGIYEVHTVEDIQ